MGLAGTALGGQAERRGEAKWPTANHFRLRLEKSAQQGVPIAADLTLPPAFNPDSVRIIPEGSTQILPAKVEWRNPAARVSFIATGATSYWCYYDEGHSGETTRLTAPAMVGTGDRITFGTAGVRGRLAVGLHPPMAFA
jgi:hypothetical protein